MNWWLRASCIICGVPSGTPCKMPDLKRHRGWYPSDAVPGEWFVTHTYRIKASSYSDILLGYDEYIPEEDDPTDHGEQDGLGR